MNTDKGANQHNNELSILLFKSGHIGGSSRLLRDMIWNPWLLLRALLMKAKARWKKFRN